jgi:protein involved in polysaccharide export with SLBB domain
MRIKKFITTTLLIGFIFLGSQNAFAQDILKGKDLSQFRVDLLSTSDIEKLKSQLESSGMSADQAEQLAISKGMQTSEAFKLKQLIQQMSTPIPNKTNGVLNASGENKTISKEINSSEQLDSLKRKKEASLIDSLIFGSELYTKYAPNFEPNYKIATPINYILGPDDKLQISVYGVQEYNGEVVVSAEGYISIPNVGQIKVSGLTIEAATQKIKTLMGNSVYSYLKSGESKLIITLSKIRSIKITIIGSNHPGNYNISSLSTVFNALYLAGGPSKFGSFREIELIRNNKVERKIDLYRFILNGDQSDNIGLKDNDVIRIPSYNVRVEFRGQIKRPGIFEVLPGENADKILNFASGFTDTAYKAMVKVYKLTDNQREVNDLLLNQFQTYLPKSGDIFFVSKISNKYKNRIILKGAVYRPDVYELSSGLRVADLIRKADGLKDDAYTGRGLIFRLQEDLSKSILSFDVKKALAGEESNNFLLHPEDEVVISSVLDLQDSLSVRVQGEIRNPGKYDYVKNLTLKDLILQAGGFSYAAFKNIEIARLIKRDSVEQKDERKSIIINTSINGGDLSNSDAAILLNPFDVVTIRRVAGYQLPESVMVQGQVQFPGPYTLSSLNDRVSDLLKRSGGITPDAYLAGAYVKRYKNDLDKEKSADANEKLQKTITKKDKDSTGFVSLDLLKEFDKIPLDFEYILKNPGSNGDIILKSRDELIIPKFDGQVRVSGEVLMTTQVPFDKKNSFKDYISSAGGFTSNALRKRIYVVYANGKAASTSHFLFFKNYPTIEPGCEVVIPRQRDKKPTSLTEIISITGILATLVTTYAVLKK